MNMCQMRDLFETSMQVWEVSRIRFLLENDCGYGIDTFQGVFVDQLCWRCYKDMKLLSESTETDVNTDRVVRQRWVCWAHVVASDPHDLREGYCCRKQVANVLEVVERQNHYNIYQNKDREERWGDWRIRLLTSMEVDIQRLRDRKNCGTVAVAALSYS
jgi:hypothetical protein